MLKLRKQQKCLKDNLLLSRSYTFFIGWIIKNYQKIRIHSLWCLSWRTCYTTAVDCGHVDNNILLFRFSRDFDSAHGFLSAFLEYLKNMRLDGWSEVLLNSSNFILQVSVMVVESPGRSLRWLTQFLTSNSQTLALEFLFY